MTSRLPESIRSRALIGAGLLMLSACGSIRKPVAVHLEEPNALVFQGDLSQEANKRLFELYKKAQVKPQLLKITSGGGDVNLGMDLGEWVFQNQLDVEVIGSCLSSCANYVFTAAKTKFLNPDSILLWHGGAHQPGLEDQLKTAGELGKAYLDAWRKREDAFFKTIHVNAEVTTYGQTASHVVRPNGTIGYDYSIADMAKFGIINVIEKGGTWRWRELHPESQDSIVRIEVRLPGAAIEGTPIDKSAVQPAVGANR